MRYFRDITVTILSAIVATLSSCGSKPVEAQGGDDILVTFGDSTLTKSDVLRRIPRGLDPADSAHLFSRIVDGWIRDLVLSDVAEKNISDPERIERMVEAYRNSLIVNEYLQSMSDKAGSHIPESRIREYYDANHEQMVLTQPLVKGAYLKVSENDESLDNLRRWMTQFTDESFDKIEKSGLRQASQYKYFKDEWHEWNVITDQIPYRFYDADAFVRSTKNFETNDGGSVYLLHISEYLPSGTEMPYEFARLKIREILRVSDIAAMRNNLMIDIYRQRIDEGKLRPGLYDPVAGRMKEDSETKQQKTE